LSRGRMEDLVKYLDVFIQRGDPKAED